MRVCEICGKRTTVGRQYTTRGLPKRTGGIGIKITGNTKRRFKANIQKVRAKINGNVRSMRVCTNCIKSNKITKA